MACGWRTLDRRRERSVSDRHKYASSNPFASKSDRIWRTRWEKRRTWNACFADRNSRDNRRKSTSPIANDTRPTSKPNGEAESREQLNKSLLKGILTKNKIVMYQIEGKRVNLGTGMAEGEVGVKRGSMGYNFPTFFFKESGVGDNLERFFVFHFKRKKVSKH